MRGQGVAGEAQVGGVVGIGGDGGTGRRIVGQRAGLARAKHGPQVVVPARHAMTPVPCPSERRA